VLLSQLRGHYALYQRIVPATAISTNTATTNRPGTTSIMANLSS
jgi:hypothetical protein